MNLRKAAQQALEALMKSHTHPLLPDDCEEAITALRAALAEPEQEPVGHADLGINNIYIFSALEPRVVPVGRTPLYTAPTPRKPLTEDQIVDIWAGVSMDYDDEINIIELGRAIERAHGIGEQHE